MKLYLRGLISLLIFSGASTAVGAWEKAVQCDNHKFILDVGTPHSPERGKYQVVIRDQSAIRWMFAALALSGPTRLYDNNRIMVISEGVPGPSNRPEKIYRFKFGGTKLTLQLNPRFSQSATIIARSHPDSGGPEFRTWTFNNCQRFL